MLLTTLNVSAPMCTLQVIKRAAYTVYMIDSLFAVKKQAADSVHLIETKLVHYDL